MNCEKCLALLSEFLDGELNSVDCAALKTHLLKCLPCAATQNDFLAIRVCCEETRIHVDAPPNAQALWLRISNIIESEQSALVKLEAKKPLAETASWHKNLFQTMDRSWKLSLQQVVSAVFGIVVITSLIT
ncbi:MAG: zf-HC2 domain-containing protein, partial [Pyrinomonadaceae bacterium]|nr:zf-HC2 domain-containing protein [Pyrinomonadaceae bacterium]